MCIIGLSLRRLLAIAQGILCREATQLFPGIPCQEFLDLLDKLLHPTQNEYTKLLTVYYFEYVLMIKSVTFL